MDFNIRARLGYLSGHKTNCLRMDKDSQRQQWGKILCPRTRNEDGETRLIHKNQFKVTVDFDFQVQFESYLKHKNLKPRTIKITLYPPI